MASTSETLLVEQMKELQRDLKALSIQLRSLELAQEARTSSPTLVMVQDHDHEKNQTPHTFGYVNWDSPTHDILKTEQWKKLSVFTDYCGKLERGVTPSFYAYIKLDDTNVVDEETRFPKDDVYVNVSNPLVRAEILYIKELRAKKPVTGLVERFLNTAKGDMHTLSSFEKKYGLKWVEKSSEVSSLTMAVPVRRLTSTPDNNSIFKPVSWSLPEDTELEEVGSDHTPFKKENLSEDEVKTQELSKKFKNILDKLTPQKFDFLLEEVYALEVYTQKQMEIVVDLLYEKVLEEPDSSQTCAYLCSKLARLKTPSDDNPNGCVNFRGLIINKCQTHFVTGQSNKEGKMKNVQVDTNDPATKEEFQTLIEVIDPITQMRAVANIKFIGELYKLGMITCKIIDYCLTYLVDDLKEQKIECLCELLITVGKEFENRGMYSLDAIFKKLQKTIDDKSRKMSSRVQFMIQDVIELRKRGWVIKKLKAFPKTMDQIQDETEKMALLIESMNAFEVGGRGDNVHESTMISHAMAKHRTCYTVDALKLEAATQETLNYIKLPPKCFESIKENMYSVLEKIQASLTSPGDTLTHLYYVSPCHSNTSIEKLKFNSRANLVTPQVLLTNSELKMAVKSIIDESLINPDNEELVVEVKQLFQPQYHPAVVNEILNMALEKPIKEIDMIARSLNYLVATNTISPENFVTGVKSTLKYAPDLLIDIPKIYEYLGKIIAPHIENNHITLDRTLNLSKHIIISANQSHLFLKSIIDCLRKSMGEVFLKRKCQESGLQLSKWMSEKLVLEWISDNDFEFLQEFL